MNKPTFDEMMSVANSLGLHLSPAECEEYLSLMAGGVEAYTALEQMPEELPVVRYPRTPGHPPQASENPYNAWYWKSTIQGASRGKLKGRTFAIKDNVCVAGVPMMNGASTLQGYVPEIDATVITRILDAGGTILGKAHCEYFCASGGSHTNAMGPVVNPRKAGYASGGSSSGSAVLVATGEVDMAIGGDQGGSIRMPSAWSGTVGMKPTHGLVPYSGIMPIESTIDHAGPITANVADNALFLEVLAGPDGLDPRQVAGLKTAPYTKSLGGSARQLRVAVVREGFGHPQSESASDDVVRQAAETFAKLGATVSEVSLPMHRSGMAIWSAIVHEGLTAQMLHGNGFGFNWKGLYVPSLMRAHDAWRTRADEFSATLKVTMLLGQFVLSKHRGTHYAKAQNLLRRLVAAYDAVLSEHDVLLMPTMPMKATPLPPADASITEICTRGFEMMSNTAPFNATGHPAMSIPCGEVEGLPIGMMLVGRHWDEATVYRAAHAYEQRN